MAQSAQVLIAGAGPVGLTLAIELGLRGIPCVLIDKRDGSVPLPKMSGVTPRGMEICRRWGIADRVRSAGIPENHPGDIVYFTSLCGPELARWEIPAAGVRNRRGYTPEPPCKCSQLYFDPILAAFARSLPALDVRYDTTLKSFTADGDGVTARLQSMGSCAEQELRCAYLIGCDGPNGVVRPSLGIELEGLGTVANSTNIFLRSRELASLHDKGWAHVYRAIDVTGCWSELIPVNDTDLWRLTVFDDPSGGAHAHDMVRRFVGADFAFEILSVLPWERRDHVARGYGEGRVFVAGDAAHECSPTGGLGMHTGIEEALNLGWKIAAMVGGWGGPALLASYAAERRPIAVRNVHLATRSFQSIKQIPGYREGDRSWQQTLRENLSRYIVTEHLRMQYCYEDSPICVADGTEPVVENHLKYTPSARPGTRAPHLWIDDATSILDLFGLGFTLLRLGPDAPEGSDLIAAAQQRGVPIASAHLPSVEAKQLYEADLCLVRPDGHVAWRSTQEPAVPAALIDHVRGALRLVPEAQSQSRTPREIRRSFEERKATR